VGLSGLKPALAAIEKGMTVALATKEVMVVAGALVAAAAKKRGVRILPVDSEHSALFQCMQGGGEVSRLVLTASGGPFLDAPENLDEITPAQALNHPRWKMGPKVTVDSSTMMNKGFEILEARWLFDIPVDRIDVVVHPESVVHSLVEFADGATLAQLSPPDMRVPIQYAFSWPERLAAERERLDLAKLGALTFRRPDEKRFPALRLVKEAEKAGGTRTAALSAADEIAVERFLRGEIAYTDIVRLTADVTACAEEIPCDSLEAVFAADAAARSLAKAWKPSHKIAVL
jgi:1-deoxy-D-xylulose-5-phosphate reductoisomerase